MTMQIGLPPVVGDSAGVLLLGSFPSEKSLHLREYYANPRNQFWRLCGALFGAHFELPYGRRIEVLKQSRVALWDVISACERKGSLDVAINTRTAIANDISEFICQNRSVKMVGLNGTTATDLFDRRFGNLRQECLQIVSLPSSSSAHAAMPFGDKVRAWSVLQILRN